MKLKKFSLDELASNLGAKVYGDESIIISGLATLQSADRSQISFLANPVYEKYLAQTQAGAVIISDDVYSKVLKGLGSMSVLIHPNPYLAYAQLSHLWDNSPEPIEGPAFIHSNASIHESAVISAGAFIDSGAVVQSGVVIHEGVVIGANCVVGEDSIIGKNTRLHANVTLYHAITIGSDCLIHSGAVIGSDGFGFAPNKGAWDKIAQLGSVVIEDNVEIGANTAIDRGALDNTVIEEGVKLDNQIQIAHNVRIGKNTAMAACCAVAGSTVIGSNCVIGGASGIAGHLTIVDNVHITAMTMVIKSLTTAGVYSSGTGVQPNDKWRKSIARLRQLDKMAKRLAALEKLVKTSS